MPKERNQPPESAEATRWRYATAALIIAVMLGLAVYLTVRNGAAPLEIVGPLLGAALWALYNYRASGRGGQG